MDSSRKKLYVGNLNFKTKEEVVESLFLSNNFDIEEVLIIKDKVSGRSKGFAFVVLSDESRLDDAIVTLNGTVVDGRQVKVSIAKPPVPRDKRRQEPVYDD